MRHIISLPQAHKLASAVQKLTNKLYVAHNMSNLFRPLLFDSRKLTCDARTRLKLSWQTVHSNNKPKTHTKDIIYAFKCNNNIGRNGHKNETEYVYGCERDS